MPSKKIQLDVMPTMKKNVFLILTSALFCNMTS